MKPSKITFGAKPGKSIFGTKQKVAPVSYKSETPDIEADAEEELTELQKAFREKARKEKELQDKNVDTEFWSCIVFKSRQQRDEFCQLLGVSEEDSQYLNGQKLIKALQLRIEQVE